MTIYEKYNAVNEFLIKISRIYLTINKDTSMRILKLIENKLEEKELELMYKGILKYNNDPLSLPCFMFSYDDRGNEKLLLVTYDDISYLLANSVVK